MEDARKTYILATLVRQTMSDHGQLMPKPKILDVGCGNGMEASTLSLVFGTRAVGIDLAQDFEFDEKSKEHADLMVADATNLPFDENTFDLVYSFHTLEHIPQCEKALSEMRRVLKPNGTFMIGTPNKSRLVGYWSSDGITWKQRFLFNWDDWKMKFHGKFENRYGAHAGFTGRELRNMLKGVFQGEILNITSGYYLGIYARYRWMVLVLVATGLSKFLFPAVYFFGINSDKSRSSS